MCDANRSISSLTSSRSARRRSPARGACSSTASPSASSRDRRAQAVALLRPRAPARAPAMRSQRRLDDREALAQHVREAALPRPRASRAARPRRARRSRTSSAPAVPSGSATASARRQHVGQAEHGRDVERVGEAVSRREAAELRDVAPRTAPRRRRVRRARSAASRSKRARSVTCPRATRWRSASRTSRLPARERAAAA